VSEEPLIEDLLELAYSFYPRGILSDTAAYYESPEWQRLEAARSRAWQSRDRWTHLLGVLRQSLPDCRIEDWTHLDAHMDAGYRCRVELPPLGEPRHAIVVCPSILTPHYMVYSSRVRWMGSKFAPAEVRFEFDASERDYQRSVARAIETELGVQMLPPEVGMTPVPYLSVRNRNFGEVTLYDCLFTDDCW
jgi:hypothetical protein